MNIRVVLVGIEGSMNLGFIVRTCKNFGVNDIYLVNPEASLEEAYKYVAKARDLLEQAIITNDLGEALKDADLVVATSAKGYSIGDVLRQSISIEEFIKIVKQKTGNIALMFGRESTGLTREEISMADILVSIPANPEYPVLNISQSVAIFLWELWKIRGREPANIPPRASREELEKIIELLESVTRNVLSDENKIARIMRVLNRIIFRSMPSKYEARILVYWIRRILHNLKQT